MLPLMSLSYTVGLETSFDGIAFYRGSKHSLIDREVIISILDYRYQALIYVRRIELICPLGFHGNL